jgi:kynurenine 3-monooxygenase
MILFELYEPSGRDWAAAVAAYEVRRKPEADTIAQLARDHFQLLDHGAGTAGFLARERAALALQRVRPDLTSVYHNVSFTCWPYTRCVEVGRAHERVLDAMLGRLAGGLEASDSELESAAREALGS